MALIANLQHYLDSHGQIPEHLPGPAYNLALFLGSITSWVTSHPAGSYPRTNVPCRRRPGRRRCAGFIHARLQPDRAIIWECPYCGDNGLIRDWEQTGWDRRRG